MLKDILQPVIMTYNRKNLLENTLSQIISDDSPIKDCEIIILDNASDDGTSEMCEELCQKHPNFRHIRHRMNIGSTGNAIEAMRIVDKKYLWILCDDDNFDWQDWDVVEKALYEDYDAVYTRDNVVGRYEYPYTVNNSAFLPNTIYNTKHITSTTLQNAYGIAHTLLPYQAMTFDIVNNNGKFFVPKNIHPVVIESNNRVENKEYSTHFNRDLYYKLGHFNIIEAYINSYMLIKDKKLRQECMDVLCQDTSFRRSVRVMLGLGTFEEESSFFETFGNLADEQRKIFIEEVAKRVHTHQSVKKILIKFGLYFLFIIIKNWIYSCKYTTKKKYITLFGIHFEKNIIR